MHKKVQNKSDCLQTLCKWDNKTSLYGTYIAGVMHAKINKRLGSVLHRVCGQ